MKYELIELEGSSFLMVKSGKEYLFFRSFGDKDTNWIVEIDKEKLEDVISELLSSAEKIKKALK